MTLSAWFEPDREAQLLAWLRGLPAGLGLALDGLHVAASDASPRRYWRLPLADGRSAIVMDAPTAHNDLAPFCDVQERLLRAGLSAPMNLAADPSQGFLLMTDLGASTYLPALQAAQAGQGNAESLMRAAIATLVRLQREGDAEGLPPYDEALIRRELQLFPDWCVQREFGQAWDATQQRHWESVCGALVGAFADQPQVLVHRDFMPRNLMLPPTEGAAPGVLDFQDAVRGPAGYDIASLLRDAFVSWDEAQELDWAIRYWEQARKAGIDWDEDFGQVWRRIEWTALQRHLKVLGIFCRLKHRDGKPAYAEDLPRFFAYATKTAMRYRELAPLVPLLEALRPGLTAVGVTMR
jgi:aminoglycoside/choline kinase family phosphotransferase